MQSRLLYLFTRTPLHVGAGSSVGAIDQPVVRERNTGFPIIPGSALKGVLADAHGATSNPNEDRSEKNRRLFGSTKADDNQAFAGSLSFGEGKILLFSVRTAQGCFAWITCPFVLARWAAQRSRAVPPCPPIGTTEALADAATIAVAGKAVLEDSVVTVSTPVPMPLLDALSVAFAAAAPAYLAHFAPHLAIVSDDLFAHLVSTCCEVQQHVRLDDATGTAAPGALFNQENVPSECLFFASITELRSNALAELAVPRVLQVGADATTGLGFCDATLAEA